MQGTPDLPIAIVIPAYKPSDGLVDLVRELARKTTGTIVVVDDGSGPEYRDVFARVAELPQVQLLRHAVNLARAPR